MSKPTEVNAPLENAASPKTVSFTITLTGPVTVVHPEGGMTNPDGCGEFVDGWASKISNRHAAKLVNEIFQADKIVYFCFKNRWLLNKAKPGPRVLVVEYGRKFNLRDGQTATHFYARKCARYVRAGKIAAERGNIDEARTHWANAEIAADGLCQSWLRILATKEAARVRGQKTGQNAQRGEDSRRKVKKILLSLPEDARYARGVTALVSSRTGLGATQARAHIKALEYGPRNKKRGA